MNCASRLGAGLPLSLLEVSTLAHGLYTLASYAAWWSKPLNIDEPSLISGQRARDALALMRMLSNKKKHIYLKRALSNISPVIQHSVAAATSAPIDSNKPLAAPQPGNDELTLALKAARRYGISTVELDKMLRGPLESDGAYILMDYSINLTRLFMFDGIGGEWFLVIICFRSSMARCICSAGALSFLRSLSEACGVLLPWTSCRAGQVFFCSGFSMQSALWCRVIASWHRYCG